MQTFRKKQQRTFRYPNLQTILMIEDYLKEQARPVCMSEISKNIPKKVMHPTLKIILEYLWESKKITYTPKGILWTFIQDDQFQQLLDDSHEI